MLGMQRNHEPIKGEAAKRIVESLHNNKGLWWNTMQPFKLTDASGKSNLYYDFWLLPNIRFSNTYEHTLRISWLFWGINIFFGGIRSSFKSKNKIRKTNL